MDSFRNTLIKLQENKDTYQSYGLQSSLWRKIRKYHSGTIEIPIRNSEGEIIGNGIVSRYDSIIHLKGCEFSDMSIKWLLKDTKDNDAFGLGGNDIPIGQNRW